MRSTVPKCRGPNLVVNGTYEDQDSAVYHYKEMASPYFMCIWFFDEVRLIDRGDLIVDLKRRDGFSVLSILIERRN